jgi:Domain of unknown function (DUF4136)
MRRNTVLVTLFFTLIICAASAQKVKVGFDKTADFSKYHSYSWAKLSEDTEITLRRVAVMSEIDYGLKNKGLKQVDEGGDLLLYGTGGIGGDIGGEHQQLVMPVPATTSYPMATAWSGVPVAAGSYVISGNLVLEFVDRSTNGLVWQGAVSAKVDTDRKKNAKRVRAAIAKLLERYPPKK